MKTLSLQPSPHTQATASLIRTRRLELKKLDKSSYTVDAVSKIIGCSKTNYTRLEDAITETYQVKWLYGISKALEIPLNELCATYLGLSNEETKKHFTIKVGDNYSFSNSQLFKEKRAQLSMNTHIKVVQGDISDVVGCSKSHLAHIERGARTTKNINLLYGLAKTLDIPLWVLIRNELKLSDSNMEKVISFSPENSMVALRKNILDKVAVLPEGQLQILDNFLNLLDSSKQTTPSV